VHHKRFKPLTWTERFLTNIIFGTGSAFRPGAQSSQSPEALPVGLFELAAAIGLMLPSQLPANMRKRPVREWPAAVLLALLAVFLGTLATASVPWLATSWPRLLGAFA
jgi:hypothetical protein